jgi:2,3-bisphosphoglycerate-independent phosphoglycerate mutase
MVTLRTGEDDLNQKDQSSVILIFIDGLGIGDRNDANPLSAANNVAPISYFQNENDPGDDGSVLAQTNPRLGVDGRPQSASGQTTILTGINGPAILGYHKQGFPNEALRQVITEHSVFLQLKQLGVGPNIFANTYTPRFFTETPRWKSATTVAVEAAGMQFQRLPDLVGGKSLFHDFTNSSLVSAGYDVPLRTPSEAGKILAEVSSRHRFTLYEHFLTDKIGHDQDMELAIEHLPQLAEFVRTVVANVDLDSTTVILTSDHGNIEDLSVRNHTLNDVPTVIWGQRRDETAASITDLTHITPAIVRLLTE